MRIEFFIHWQLRSALTRTKQCLSLLVNIIYQILITRNKNTKAIYVKLNFTKTNYTIKFPILGETLHQYIPNFKPKKLMSDAAQAIFNGFSAVYPDMVQGMRFFI